MSSRSPSSVFIIDVAVVVIDEDDAVDVNRLTFAASTLNCTSASNVDTIAAVASDR